MKIAVTSSGTDLSAPVDPRFGRCQGFVIVEADDMSFEAVPNPNVGIGSGAGIQSAQLISEKGVEVVLTGNCGPNAYSTLNAAGIQVIVGAGGTVQEAVDAFKSGALGAAGGPNVQSHFGMAGGQAMGGGQGMAGGQAMGGGQGMGMGGGGGMGMGRGMGGGGGGGRGMGMGRGMGGGGGRGMGRGMGMGGGMGAVPQQQPMAPQDETQMLRQQAEAMSQQLQQIQDRLKQLEGGS